MGLLIRAEQPSSTPQPTVLTVTGLLPDQLQAVPVAQNPSPEPVVTTSSDATEADAIVIQLLRHTRYLLTLKGRPPFRLAGIEAYQRLQGVVTLSQELLAHRYDPRLDRLSAGLQTALTPLAGEYRELRQGETWLRDIASLLEPSDASPTTGLPAPARALRAGGQAGAQVACQLRAYLDDLLTLPDLSPSLDAFRCHLDKVSTSYWPGLFHCYDVAGLPRTNNDLESHFRDTQRRLLRTTGQKGQTRRALQRVGAWELLPRPPTETRCLIALREVPIDQLAKEQERLRCHQERFRLNTRSVRRVNAQFDKLRERWLALAATSTG